MLTRDSNQRLRPGTSVVTYKGKFDADDTVAIDGRHQSGVKHGRDGHSRAIATAFVHLAGDLLATLFFGFVRLGLLFASYQA